VDEGDALGAAAARELLEETGLALPPSVPPLAQFWTYGDPGRDPRGWTVTVAYGALLPAGAGRPDAKAGDDAREARWFPLAGAAAAAEGGLRRGRRPRPRRRRCPRSRSNHAKVVRDGLRALAARAGQAEEGLRRALERAAAELDGQL